MYIIHIYVYIHVYIYIHKYIHMDRDICSLMWERVTDDRLALTHVEDMVPNDIVLRVKSTEERMIARI